MTCTTQKNRRSRSFKQAAEKHWWKNSEAVFTAAWIGHQKLQEFALENHTSWTWAQLGQLFSILDKQICSFNLCLYFGRSWGQLLKNSMPKSYLNKPHDDFHRSQKVILRKLQQGRGCCPKFATEYWQ